MRYSIIITAKADEQLRDILFYIARDSGSAEIAINYLNKLERAINNLQLLPHSGVKPRYSILRKQGCLMLIVEKHLVFYKVNDEKNLVTVYVVVDGRQEYKNLI